MTDKKKVEACYKLKFANLATDVVELEVIGFQTSDTLLKVLYPDGGQEIFKLADITNSITVTPVGAAREKFLEELGA